MEEGEGEGEGSSGFLVLIPALFLASFLGEGVGLL